LVTANLQRASIKGVAAEVFPDLEDVFVAVTQLHIKQAA